MRTFNKEKFKNLVLYFAQKSAADISFGSIKLNKLFYYSDFWSYAITGQSITGASYLHKQRGPVPSQMGPILQEMEKAGDIRRVAIPNYINGGEQIRVSLTEQAQPKVSGIFSDEELEICDYHIKFLMGKTAEETSDISHNWLGWLYTNEGEEIPYNTIYVRKTEPVSIADLKWAENKLTSLGI